MILSDVFLNQQTASAPPQISMALQTTKTIDQDAADIYEDFLEHAALAEKVCRETGIQILGQYKLTDALPANLNPDEATNTLLLIFQFYAKIKTASSHATFSAQEDDVNFMSFSKVEIFCRDFKVVPRLLTREELKMLWGDIARAHVLAGRGVFTVIDFDEFKDLIIRMALWAYHKPGLKKLIITLEGFMPRNAEILQSFCHYLKLPDVQFINNFIRTKGRQTQGELNYRSKGETNLRTRMEVRADTDARKLSQVQSNTNGASKSKTSSKTPGKGKKVNIYGELEYEERHLRGANPSRVVRLQPVPGASPGGGAVSSPEKAKSRVSLLPPSLQEKMQPMDSTALLLLLKKVSDNSDNDDGFALDSEASRTPRHTGNTPKKKNSSAASSSRSNKDDELSDDEDEEFHPKTHSTFKKKKNKYATPTYHFSVPDESDDDDDNVSVASSVISVFHDSSLEALRAAYEADYDVRLAKKELGRYCYVPPVANSTDFLPTKGPVVDLGLLQSGAKVTVQFRVSNGSGDDIFIDAIARDFHAEDTHISTYSKMLIPGFARHVSVTFTVPRHNCRVLGFVDVACVAPRHTTLSMTHSSTGGVTHGGNITARRKKTDFLAVSDTGGRCLISCPVFYRVDHLAHRDIYPVCTSGSLRPLLSRSSRRCASPLYNTSSSRAGTAQSVNNVIQNSRLGSASGTARSDWDTSFMAQRLVQQSLGGTSANNSAVNTSKSRTQQTHLSGAMNHGFSRPTTSGSTPVMPLSRNNSEKNRGLERWPSGRFTTLTEVPATRTSQQQKELVDILLTENLASINHSSGNPLHSNVQGSGGMSPLAPLSRHNSYHNHPQDVTGMMSPSHKLHGSSPLVNQPFHLPRPSSPVPPSISGRTYSSGRLLDSTGGDGALSPLVRTQQKSQPRLLDNLNQTAHF